MSDNYLRWSEIAYGGEVHPPNDAVDPQASSWPMYYLKREGDSFYGPNGKISFQIRSPESIDWNKQLSIVQSTLKNITTEQVNIATYWGTGPATKQWTPIIDRLIDTYGLTPTKAARVLAAVQAGMNDTFVVAWYYKYLWDVARPIQYDPKLKPILCTPRFPTYVSGHAAVSGCAETILSYFFPSEARRLKELAEQNAKSRLYAGVHFTIDNDEGLRLGRQIGKVITNELHQQRAEDGSLIDNFNRLNLHADLLPPPYTQAIPFDFKDSCTSNTVYSNNSSEITNVPKPRIFI